MKDYSRRHNPKTASRVRRRATEESYQQHIWTKDLVSKSYR